MARLEQDITNIQETVKHLRKMRSAVHDRRKNPHMPREAVVYDARELSEATGMYLALSALEADTDLSRDEWLETNSSMRHRYSEYKPATHAETAERAVAVSIYDKVKTLRVDPEHLLKWEFVTGNNFDVESLAEFLERQVGVVAPLSGDYLRGVLYRQYIQIVMDKSFPLKMAVPNNSLNIIFFDRETSGIPFEETTEIGIYLDAISSGRTGELLFNATSIAFDKHMVHAPLLGKPDLVPSQKMIDARYRS